MKAPITTLTQHLWVFIAPFCWLIGLAITHELCSSQGALRAQLEALVSLTHPAPSAQLLGLAGMLIGALCVLGLMWITHQQNQPAQPRPLLKGSPTNSERGAAVLLLFGAVIIGSELDNVLNHMGGLKPQASSLGQEELMAWREALWSPWGWGYELIALPIAECFLFHHVVQRCVPIHNERLRVAFTALVMTTFSWRLSSAPLLVNLCSAWLFERVRAPLLSLGFYVDYQLIGWLIALGYGPQVEGFDLLSSAWQPWGFDLIGVCALLSGAWLLERTPTFSERQASIEWRALIQAELDAQRVAQSRDPQRRDEDPEAPPSDEEER